MSKCLFQKYICKSRKEIINKNRKIYSTILEEGIYKLRKEEDSCKNGKIDKTLR